mgnify:CR=1 FL=1
MTYIGKSSISTALFNFTFTGNPATNDYMTLNTLENNISGASISGTSLTLPPGGYLLQACIGADRTSGSNAMDWRIEQDSTLIGSVGSMDNSVNDRQGVDQCVAQFESGSSSTVKIKVTSATSSAWTISQNYSYLLVIRNG